MVVNSHRFSCLLSLSFSRWFEYDFKDWTGLTLLNARPSKKGPTQQHSSYSNGRSRSQIWQNENTHTRKTRRTSSSVRHGIPTMVFFPLPEDFREPTNEHRSLDVMVRRLRDVPSHAFLPKSPFGLETRSKFTPRGARDAHVQTSEGRPTLVPVSKMVSGPRRE